MKFRVFENEEVTNDTQGYTNEKTDRANNISRDIKDLEFEGT